MKNRIRLLVLFILYSASISTVQSNPFNFHLHRTLPIVLVGKQLPTLIGEHPNSIYGLSFRNNSWVRFPIQIDHKGKANEYLFKDSEQLLFDANDELVFMAKDASTVPADFDLADEFKTVVPLTLVDPVSQNKAWVNIVVVQPGAKPPAGAVQDYISYNDAEHAIVTDTIKVEFSKQKPMLIENLYWKDATTGKFNADVLDTMKLLHTGKFLRTVPFRRTHNDYKSSVSGVIDGPIRVIRRTKNNVRIVWQLKSPSIFIDYIIYPHTMIMDMILDIPFSPKMFFSELDTFASLDWNQQATDPDFQLHHPALIEPLPINGSMSKQKSAFNGQSDVRMGVGNSEGVVYFTFQIQADLPIQQSTYLLDDNQEKDELDTVPGSYGTSGFYTTGWDQLERGKYHLIHKVLLDRQIDPSFAWKWLQ